MSEMLGRACQVDVFVSFLAEFCCVVLWCAPAMLRQVYVMVRSLMLCRPD